MAGFGEDYFFLFKLFFRGFFFPSVGTFLPFESALHYLSYLRFEWRLLCLSLPDPSSVHGKMVWDSVDLLEFPTFFIVVLSSINSSPVLLDTARPPSLVPFFSSIGRRFFSLGTGAAGRIFFSFRF